MQATKSEQEQLLKIQELDLSLAQLSAQAKSLPGRVKLTELESELKLLQDRLVAAETKVSDLERIGRKAAADVADVRTRAKRDEARLQQTHQPKAAEGLQRELEALARRQAELEEEEYRALEALEEAKAYAAQLAAHRSELEEQKSELIAQLQEKLNELKLAAQATAAERKSISQQLTAELVTHYETIRSRTEGIAVALLQARRCQGCQLELNLGDLEALRAIPANQLAYCPECNCILVRNEHSGL